MLQICLNLQIQATAYGAQSGKLWSQQLALRTSQTVLRSEHRLTKRLKKELLSIHEVKTERNSIAIAIFKKNLAPCGGPEKYFETILRGLLPTSNGFNP